MTAQTKTLPAGTIGRMVNGDTTVDRLGPGAVGSAVPIAIGGAVIAIGGAEIADGLLRVDPVSLLLGTLVLVFGGVDLALGVRNAIDTVAERTAHLLRRDIRSLERR